VDPRAGDGAIENGKPADSDKVADGGRDTDGGRVDSDKGSNTDGKTLAANPRLMLNVGVLRATAKACTFELQGGSGAVPLEVCRNGLVEDLWYHEPLPAVAFFSVFRWQMSLVANSPIAPVSESANLTEMVARLFTHMNKWGTRLPAPGTSNDGLTVEQASAIEIMRAASTTRAASRKLFAGEKGRRLRLIAETIEANRKRRRDMQVALEHRVAMLRFALMGVACGHCHERRSSAKSTTEKSLADASIVGAANDGGDTHFLMRYNLFLNTGGKTGIPGLTHMSLLFDPPTATQDSTCLDDAVRRYAKASADSSNVSLPPTASDRGTLAALPVSLSVDATDASKNAETTGGTPATGASQSQGKGTTAETAGTTTRETAARHGSETAGTTSGERAAGGMGVGQSGGCVECARRRHWRELQAVWAGTEMDEMRAPTLAAWIGAEGMASLPQPHHRRRVRAAYPVTAKYVLTLDHMPRHVAERIVAQLDPHIKQTLRILQSSIALEWINYASVLKNPKTSATDEGQEDTGIVENSANKSSIEAAAMRSAYGRSTLTSDDGERSGLGARTRLRSARMDRASATAAALAETANPRPAYTEVGLCGLAARIFCVRHSLPPEVGMGLDEETYDQEEALHLSTAWLSIVLQVLPAALAYQSIRNEQMEVAEQPFVAKRHCEVANGVGVGVGVGVGGKLAGRVDGLRLTIGGLICEYADPLNYWAIIVCPDVMAGCDSRIRSIYGVPEADMTTGRPEMRDPMNKGIMFSHRLVPLHALRRVHGWPDAQLWHMMEMSTFAAYTLLAPAGPAVARDIYRVHLDRIARDARSASTPEAAMTAHRDHILTGHARRLLFSDSAPEPQPHSSSVHIGMGIAPRCVRSYAAQL
jgi:hypothetical protein